MITIKQWKDLLKFEPISEDGKFDIDGTVKQIATVRGKTEEEIENTIAVEELLPEFLRCIHDVNGMIYQKLDVIPKNGKGDKQ